MLLLLLLLIACFVYYSAAHSLKMLDINSPALQLIFGQFSALQISCSLLGIVFHTGKLSNLPPQISAEIVMKSFDNFQGDPLTNQPRC